MAEKTKKLRIAAIGDIHVGLKDAGKYRHFFETISKQADVLCIAGDLTTTGTVEEAKILAEDLQYCTIPVVGVLGNHDYESGQEDQIKQILTVHTAQFLYGESVVIEDVGFAGIKGFSGGFDKYMLPLWGERQVKAFVQEVVDESLKLDSALSRLDTLKKVVILHYSPIRETVIGEHPEIYAFLGSSRLLEPIHRREVSVVFHGHAHMGTFEGKTTQNIPVYNVSQTIVEQKFPELGCFIFEL